MFEYGQIIEYIDATYNENFNAAHKWCALNNATFDELVDQRKMIGGELHRFFKINKIDKTVTIQDPVEIKKTLDELKAQKRAEINAHRDGDEQGGFEYLDKTFDSDPVSCQRISCAAQAMQYAADDATITWTTKDNSTIDLNKNQLSGLVVALAQWSNTCHQKATALKAKIEAAQTAEELEKILWDETPLIL